MNDLAKELPLNEADEGLVNVAFKHHALKIFIDEARVFDGYYNAEKK